LRWRPSAWASDGPSTAGRIPVSGSRLAGWRSPHDEITPGERTGTFRLGGDDLLIAADGTSFISAEDYAVALVDEAEKSTAIRRRITVAY
jgi:putative NADH-flavin reductase